MDSKQLTDGAVMQISQKALQELRIPANIKVSILPIGKQEFRLGPLIGILTSGRVCRNRTFNFYLNYSVMLKSGLLYIFSYQGLNTKTKTITGYYFNHSEKTWVPAELPYPDVVIDRVYPNTYWAHRQLEKVIGRGKIFNKKSLINKLDFYTALSADSFLKTHVPVTKTCTNPANLENFLKTHRKLFIKPLNGMQGRGIITVSLENNAAKCRFMLKGKVIEKKLTGFDEIWGVLQHFGHPRRRYIMQNAIPRMEYRGGPFCFRVMVCKNGSGQWLVPAIFTKTATGASFLTNHAAGARFVSLKNLFKEIEGRLGYDKTQFINQLIDLGVKTAGILDQKYGPLGELGLDMVVDRSGKPWLIEANGNPGMVPRSHMIEFPHWVYQMFNLPVSYAIYLAGFNN
ncbi:MAG: hypothetical protein CVV03_06010 [Firmicutes bacterium HGW-Firmicutes-8]|nr:MAG: hypothetical protein CVV03_06010 [Firmicutes bacterium HGW-Firmicutes-8]